jgi:heterodisulfide reductase subunit A
VTGRVCHHPCESNCERRRVDEPIAIAYLKRFLADHELHNNPIMPNSIPRIHDNNVAIVGSGPAGLTAAYHLALKGYGVTIFEALSVPGGMLVRGIPPFRLPRDIIEYEINWIKALGIELCTEVTVGKDISFEALQDQGYPAIFVAVGAYKGRKLRIPGEDEFTGFIDSLTFLERVNFGDHRKPGDDVCIIGGGNAAIDSARTALRLGCKNVTIVYRRSRREMPANLAEIEEAEEEGVEIHYLASPVRILGTDGRVIGMECIRNRLGEPDASGRRRPVPIEGTEFIVDADTIIPAISQSPDLSFLPEDHGFNLTRWNTFEVNQNTLETNKPGIFAGGDAVTGPATVVEAMAAGKLAAKMIERHLTGQDLETGHTPPKTVAALTSQEVTETEKIVRQIMPKRSLSSRLDNFEEVELGYTEDMAVTEASRCLRCWTFSAN